MRGSPVKRRKKQAEESGASWLDTYADMITLVLVFFVLLFSFSTIDAQKWREIMNSLNMKSEEKGAFMQTGDFVKETNRPGFPPDATGSPEPSATPAVSPTPEPTPKVGEEQSNYFDELYHKVSNFIDREDLETQVFVMRQKNGVLLRFSENILFDSGRAYLLDTAEETLGIIAPMLNEVIEDVYMVRVEGHTDDRPIRTDAYPSNWELSAARSVAVVRYLTESQEMDPKKFSVVAYSKYAPIADNDSNENRHKNRRVDIFIEGNQSN